MQVTYYEGVMSKEGKPVSLDRMLNAIKIGKWEKPIATLRTMQNEDDQKKYKNVCLPCFTGSGLFGQHSAEGLKEHNGILVADIDAKDNPTLLENFEGIRKQLIADQYTHFLFTSCRGQGFAIGTRIDKVKHKECFDFLEQYYKETYNLAIDKACKDVSRLRFVSHDPELFFNDHAAIVSPLEKKSISVKQSNIHESAGIMDAIIASGKMLGDDSYDSWLKIGFGLATEFGEGGRGYFHALSQTSAKYDQRDCDKKFGSCLRAKGSVTFGTILYLAKCAGVQFFGKDKKAYLRREQIEYATDAFTRAYNKAIDNNTPIEEIKKCLQTQIADDTGIVDEQKLSDELDDLYENGDTPGVFPGWESLRQYYTIRPGEITVITGIPAHGKSSFLTNMLVKVAAYEEWKFALYSPENRPARRYASQIMQMFIDKPFRAGYPVRMSKEDYLLGKEFVLDSFKFIEPEDTELSIEGIIMRATLLVLEHGIKGLVIDPWNEVDHSRPPGMNETEYISRCLSRLRHFARKYAVHVWLVAHPTKMQKQLDGTYPVPTPYDIAGSGHFRNKADICMCIYRNFAEDKVDVHIQKVRFQEVGKIGSTELRYIPSTTSFKEVD